MVAVGVDAPLVAGLAALARTLARRPGGEAVVMSERPDGVVVRVAGVVIKAHPPGTDPAQLATRLRLSADPALDGVLLAPLALPNGALVNRLGDRAVTAWPAGEPVSPEHPDAAPWHEAGRLLAQLHTTAAAGAGPAAGGPARVARAVARLARDADRHPAAAPVREALATLPPWAVGAAPPPPGRPRTICHGDWHLGQLVRVPGRGWRLVDVDDLGHGDPAWDLARPAAWYATGLMPAPAWREFLDSYRRYAGPAVPSHGDPWPAIDVVARALVVQMAALAVAAAGQQGRALDEVEQTLLDTCRTITAEACGADVP